VKRLTWSAIAAVPLSLVLVAPVGAEIRSADTPRVAVTDAGATAIEGSYIVSFRAGTDAEDVADDVDVRTEHVYDAAVEGFAARLSARQLRKIRARKDVVRVEEDAVVRVADTQVVPTWGLDRIDQRARPLSRTYTYGTRAETVRAYVVDTGIDTTHPELGGRARNVYDALGGDGRDCNGHGTHVASTLGGTTYGVAKGVQLRGVRVLGCDGSGSTSGIIAALDWIRQYAERPAVANMSLGGGASRSLDAAAAALAASGVFVAVAAGNSARDACGVSPARATGVFTVAASDPWDRRAEFSNYGGCVEAYAPGVAVRAAFPGGRSASISGTSMASPHVAGIAALYKGRNGETDSATVSAWLVQVSTPGVVRGNGGGTPNRLVFTGGL